MFLLHGLAGGWDELIIAVVAVGVLWLAVKLAGRKPPADEDAEQQSFSAEQEQPDEAAPTH